MRAFPAMVTTSVVGIALLAGAAGASAKTPVDPTSLTPPLKAFRECFEEGPWVKCDTSGVEEFVNLPTDKAPCGLLYETSTEVSHSTRWYEDGLLVRRQVQVQVSGTWTLSPTGAGPTVSFGRDISWNELFTIPGDIDSGVLTLRGSILRVPAVGAGLHESGQARPDDTHVGHLAYTDEAAARLCELLVP